MSIITLPYTFVGGTRAIADQVNADFNAVANAVNTNAAIAITQNMTFYVAPGGVDAPGNGLTPSTPCATATYVYNLLQDNYRWASRNAVVTIQLAPGNYGEIAASGSIPGQPTAGNLIINGDVDNPQSRIITATAGTTDAAVSGIQKAMLTVQGVSLASPGGDALFASNAAFVTFGNVIFNQTLHAHVRAVDGGLVRTRGNYTVTGGCGSHWFSQGSGSNITIQNGPLGHPTTPGPVVTISGNPNTGSFAHAVGCGSVQMSSVSFVNPQNAVGPQYHAAENGVITTGTGGTLVLPGNASGTVERGGVYW